MKKIILLLLSFCCFANLLSSQTIELQTYTTGFSRPLDVVNAGDGRLFVVEQAGKIWVVDENGNKLPTPFLNIDPIVGYIQNEQGLLGLAFHPDYANNGYFYVNYTGNDEDTRISRFTVSAADPNVADPTSEKILLTVSQPYWNHNGGCLQFGPDGYLYFGLGDGGSGGDPQGNGQNLNTHLGKMHRIDVDNGDPYAIPADNPFAGSPSAKNEIWAVGLRNPWRFSFDRETGDLWIGDVGQDNWEEIDFQAFGTPNGVNFGWRCREGKHNYNTANCPSNTSLTDPVAEYQNTGAVGCSVTGGFVYRGCEFPNLYGHYLYTDYCSGRIWSITPDGAGGWTNVQLADLANNQFSSFGENKDGELFLTSLGAGTISKIKTAATTLFNAVNPACDGGFTGAFSPNFNTLANPAQAIWSDGSTDLERTSLPAGTYSVTISYGAGCSATETLELETENPFAVAPEATVGTNNLLTANGGFASYQWLLDGQPIAGANSQNYTATESGDYSVLVTNAGDCEATSNIVTVTISAVITLEGIRSVSVTPNPFGDNFRLEIFADQKMKVDITLTDLQGKTVLREKAQLNGHFDKTFDMEKVPSGMYSLTLKTAKGEWSERLVKN